MLELADEQKSPTVIKVVGVGGAGMNAVNRMMAAKLEGVEFVVVNTDTQVLAKSSASECIAIGPRTTRGMGAGGNPEIGYQAAMEDQDRLSQALRGADMVFITAGMGGGTGTGAAPIVAEIARNLNSLVVGVVTLPFRMEGERRMDFAKKGLDILRTKVDALITISNDSIFKVLDPKTSVDVAFRMVDDILLNAVRGISDLINTAGLINVDFADVCSVMGETGEAVMGAGEGVGEERARQAVNQAIHNSLLEETGIEGAMAALINVCGAENLSISEWKEVSELITSHLHSQANIIGGLTIDPSLGEHLRVTVIATGFQPHRQVADTVDTQKDGEQNPLWMSGYGQDQNQDNNAFKHYSQYNQAHSMAYLHSSERGSHHGNNKPKEAEAMILQPSREEYAALQDIAATAKIPSTPETNNGAKGKKIDVNDLDIPAYLRRRK